MSLVNFSFTTLSVQDSLASGLSWKGFVSGGVWHSHPASDGSDEAWWGWVTGQMRPGEGEWLVRWDLVRVSDWSDEAWWGWVTGQMRPDEVEWLVRWGLMRLNGQMKPDEDEWSDEAWWGWMVRWSLVRMIGQMRMNDWLDEGEWLDMGEWLAKWGLM